MHERENGLSSDDEARQTSAIALAKLEREGIILFSVQDLFGYLHAHPTMSGIQRVQAGIALHAIKEHGEHVGFILNDLTERHREGEFLLIDNAALAQIIDYASGNRVDHDQLRRMLSRCEARAHVVRPNPGSTIILLGAFWGHGNTLDRYVVAKRDGCLIGAYVYDIIPVTHPEYCDAELVRDFSISIGELALIADFIFTISDYTGETLGRLLREHGCRTIPIRTVPLAHSMTAVQTSSTSWPPALRGIKGKPYVAYVSTVEGRKNHLYVVNAWREMIAQGVVVPDLIFVGRRGWRINGLVDLLDGTHNLDGRVHIVHGLTDAELNSIYSDCLFTVFTSFVEGWGLPVGEGLVHQVPCVASCTSSIPEVGGDFVDYVDPLNLRDGVAVFRRMIEDDQYRESRRANIRNSFKARSWEDVGQDFLIKTREAMKADYPMRSLDPFLAPGRRFSVGDLAAGAIRMHDYLSSPLRIMLAGSFYRPEPFGAWMRGEAGQISFRTPLPEGTALFLFLELEVPQHGVGCTASFTVVSNSDQSSFVAQHHQLTARGRFRVRVAGRVAHEGLCTITLSVSGANEALEDDTRSFKIGLCALGYAAADDTNAREDLIEQFTFVDMTPLV